MRKLVIIFLILILVLSSFIMWGCECVQNDNKVPLEDFFEEDVIHTMLKVTVKCDEKILPASFFGKNNVKEVYKYYDYNYQNQTRDYILILNGSSRLNLIRVTRRLEKMPEVIKVNLEHGLMLFRTPNDAQ